MNPCVSITFSQEISVAAPCLHLPKYTTLGREHLEELLLAPLESVEQRIPCSLQMRLPGVTHVV